MSIWLVMLLGGLATFGMRYSFIYFFGRHELPKLLQRALRFVPPAVFAAIIFPELFFHSGRFDASLINDRLVAGILAAVTAWRTKNILLSLLAGMISLVILQLI